MNEGKRILIAEVDQGVGNEVKEYFESQGYLVNSILTTGEELLIQAKVLQPDLIITDTRLNGYIDGIEAISRLEQNLTIPYIFITSFDDDIRLIKSYFLRPLCLIQNPINLRNLDVSFSRISLHSELLLKHISIENN
jgi:DNA-binding response OmpR family regulator